MSMNKFMKALLPRLPIVLLVLVLIGSVIIFDKKEPPEPSEIVTDNHTTTEPTAFRRRVTSCSQVKPGQLDEMKKMAEAYFEADESVHNQQRNVEYIGMCVTTDTSGRTDSGIVYLIYSVEIGRDMRKYDGSVGYIWTVAFLDIYPDGSMPHDIGYLVNNVVRIDYDLDNPDPNEHYRYFYGFESVLSFEGILASKNFTVIDRNIDEKYTEGLAETSASTTTTSTAATVTTSLESAETTETLPPSEG